MEIALYGSRRQQPYRDKIQRLLRLLVLEGATLCVHPKLYDHLTVDMGLSPSGMVPCAEPPVSSSLAVSLGGDGTFLRTVKWLRCAPVPVVGINTGSLGYLTALTLDEALECAGALATPGLPAFVTERRSMLKATGPGLRAPLHALNEIVLSKSDIASMIDARVSINGHELADYRADGIIVSTPTGSTAYNLSVGGPIVQPGAGVVVLSPIAAHSLSLRPLVLDTSTAIDVGVQSRSRRFRIAADGQSLDIALDGGSGLIHIGPSDRHVLLVTTPARTFPQPLRTKLFYS